MHQIISPFTQILLKLGKIGVVTQREWSADRQR